MHINIHNTVIVKLSKDANFYELVCKYIKYGVPSPVGYYLTIPKNKCTFYIVSGFEKHYIK